MKAVHFQSTRTDKGSLNHVITFRMQYDCVKMMCANARSYNKATAGQESCVAESGATKEGPQTLFFCTHKKTYRLQEVLLVDP